MPTRRTFLSAAAAHALAVSASGAQTDGKSEKADQAVDAPPRELFVGQVVKLGEALTRKKVSFSSEVADHVVLETEQGDIIPILADWRGRAFYQDERLRNRRVELVAFHRPELSYLQVLMVYTFDDEGHRMFTDYWCDICSIPMYEIKPCECCQADIRLRFQPQDVPADVRPAALSPR